MNNSNGLSPSSLYLLLPFLYHVHNQTHTCMHLCVCNVYIYKNCNMPGISLKQVLTEDHVSGQDGVQLFSNVFFVLALQWSVSMCIIMLQLGHMVASGEKNKELRAQPAACVAFACRPKQKLKGCLSQSPVIQRRPFQLWNIWPILEEDK